MSLTVEKPKDDGTFEPIPIGLHEGILCWITDIGTHETQYGQRKMVIWTFELPNQVIEVDGAYKPKVISITLTASLHEKSNMTKLLTGWFGKAPSGSLDQRKLVGRHAMVNVTHATSGDRTFANISSLAPPTEDCKKKNPFNDLIVYEMGETVPDQLPEWIQVKIMRSREWNETGQQNHSPQDVTGATQDDDVPF